MSLRHWDLGGLGELTRDPLMRKQIPLATHLFTSFRLEPGPLSCHGRRPWFPFGPVFAETRAQRGGTQVDELEAYERVREASSSCDTVDPRLTYLVALH